MTFNEILATLPTIEHLNEIKILENGKQIHQIPAAPGKLDRTSAQKGLQLFAEHTEDARQFPGKHPNIDLLLRVIEQDLCYHIEAH